MSSTTPLLIASNLCKQYYGEQVVRSLSLAINKGEIVGFLGPNGAGKTTTVGMLYGAVIPDAGEVLINGLNLLKQGSEARRMLGVVTQEDNLDPDFSVYENLLQFATYYGMNTSVAKERSLSLLESVRLKDDMNKNIDELSGGMKRKLVFARALLHDPLVVFLDEPTTGLDPEVRAEFWRIILELKNQGRGILLTTHYMEEAEKLCDRVILIRKGEIFDEGSPSFLLEKYQVKNLEEIFLLLTGERLS
jgi:lipooligosaccharide transport system ATP-binding protein